MSLIPLFSLSRCTILDCGNQTRFRLYLSISLYIVPWYLLDRGNQPYSIVYRHRLLPLSLMLVLLQPRLSLSVLVVSLSSYTYQCQHTCALSACISLPLMRSFSFLVLLHTHTVAAATDSLRRISRLRPF